MAKATPVTSPSPEAPAAAEDKLMEPVAPKAAKAAAAAVDLKPIEDIATAALAEGKTAFIIGNAVRVDN